MARVENPDALWHYYAPDAYAGVLRRWLIVAVDIGIVTFAYVLCLLAKELLENSFHYAAEISLAAWFLFSYVYLAVLKVTPIGTLGYRLAGVKLVNGQGNRPGIGQATLRLAVIAFMPENIIIDLHWLCQNPTRQSFGDRIAETFVVMKNTTPIASKEPEYVQECFLGWTWVFREVKPENPSHQ